MFRNRDVIRRTHCWNRLCIQGSTHNSIGFPRRVCACVIVHGVDYVASDVVLRSRSESYFELNSTEVQLNHSFHPDVSYSLVMVTTIEASDVAFQISVSHAGNRHGCAKHPRDDGALSEAVFISSRCVFALAIGNHLLQRAPHHLHHRLRVPSFAFVHPQLQPLPHAADPFLPPPGTASLPESLLRICQQ